MLALIDMSPPCLRGASVSQKCGRSTALLQCGVVRRRDWQAGRDRRMLRAGPIDQRWRWEALPEMVFSVLQIVAPVFVIIAAGYRGAAARAISRPRRWRG